MTKIWNKMFRALAAGAVGLTMAAAWPAGCQQVQDKICPACDCAGWCEDLDDAIDDALDDLFGDE